MKKFALAATTVLLLAACTGNGGSESTVEQSDLQGRWASPSREALSNPDGSTPYLVRDFTFSGNNWKLNLTAFGDAQSEGSKLFTATVEGDYTLGDASAAASNATEADFGFKKITLTPNNDMFVTIFNQAKAGNGNWKLNETQDISNTGGLFFAPTSQYPTEYDLVSIDGDDLYFGQRPADNNMGSEDKRPTALTPNPVTKL